MSRGRGAVRCTRWITSAAARRPAVGHNVPSVAARDGRREALGGGEEPIDRGRIERIDAPQPRALRGTQRPPRRSSRCQEDRHVPTCSRSAGPRCFDTDLQRQPERIVGDGEQRREDGVGPLGQALERTRAARTLEVPDLLEDGGRGSPILRRHGRPPPGSAGTRPGAPPRWRRRRGRWRRRRTSRGHGPSPFLLDDPIHLVHGEETAVHRSGSPRRPARDPPGRANRCSGRRPPGSDPRQTCPAASPRVPSLPLVRADQDLEPFAEHMHIIHISGSYACARPHAVSTSQGDDPHAVSRPVPPGGQDGIRSRQARGTRGRRATDGVHLPRVPRQTREGA